MIRRILLGLGVVGVIVAALAAAAWWKVGSLGVEHVTDNLYMLTGMGGNVAVLITPDGVVVVDTMIFTRQGDAIRARIRELTDKPVVAIINTHYHLDHTHGNPAFDPGTTVLSTARTLEHLHERDADYWRDPPARDLLPNDTFETEREITVGGKRVRMFYPGRGHTDGDLVVDFVSERAIHTGDLFSDGLYPNIDLEAGGSVREWPATLDNVLARQFDHVIPGHGPLSDRAGLERFQELMRELWTQTKKAVDAGATLEQARQQVDLSRFGYKPIWFVPTMNQNFVVGRAYEEAKKGETTDEHR